MATLCLFDVDGTLTAPRQVGSAREARGPKAEPVLFQAAVTTVQESGDAGPELGAQEKGSKKKTFRAGNVFRVRKFGSEFLLGPWGLVTWTACNSILV